MNGWIAKTRDFINETMDEMSKSTWPDRSQVMETTILVIIALAATSLFVAGVDQVLFRIIQFVISF